MGYSGGHKLNPTYRNIQDHTEALLIEFDPTIISYEDLVLEWSRMHSPVGKTKCQYRSAVWYLDEEQKEIADEVVQGMKAYMSRNAASKWMAEISSSVEPVTSFYRAEEYHQNFLTRGRF